MSAPLIASFTVDGIPETKGSWVALPNGRMKRDNPREKAWATSVGWAAKARMIGRRPYDGHVAVSIDFFIPPPKGRKNQRDIDKLARSVLDAMTEIVYVDDELVTKLALEKVATQSGWYGARVVVHPAARITYRGVALPEE